jgi:hypothetical protein
MMYLYCIADDSGYCKFGYSRDPSGRVRALQTGHPSELYLLHSIAVESSRVRELESLLHEEIGLHRRVRGEWFAIDSRLAVELLEWFRIRYVDT